MTINKTKEKMISFLQEVISIHKSNFSLIEKIKKIKDEWLKLPLRIKVPIYFIVSSVGGLIVFGTGGIGIAALGSATAIPGFLATTAGGTLAIMALETLLKNENKQ